MDGRPERSLRIGEFARRAGVSEHLLRAWENRYHLLQPSRTTGGFRLYSSADLDRVHRMQALLDQGISPAQAAEQVLADDAGGLSRPLAALSGAGEGPVAEAARAALDRALTTFDEPAAQQALDRLFSELSVAAAFRTVLLPFLAALGEKWQAGEVTVAHEHFVTNVVRGRLTGLGRGWGDGRGPRLLLACAPGEQHDLALLMFGIVANRHGWRISYLGADTPLDDLRAAADSLRPARVVVSATLAGVLRPSRSALAAVAGRYPLALGGAGAGDREAHAVGAVLLDGDPVSEAERLAL